MIKSLLKGIEMRLFLKTSLLAIAIFASVSATAQRAFTPQAGTWIITEELNGRPGRGISLDVQENMMYLQLFGYLNDGQATFYSALGELKDTTFNSQIYSYQDGPYFGGPAKSGKVDKPVGDIQLKFNDGISGTIKLPGEAEKKIQRFQFNAPDPLYAIEGKLNASFFPFEDNKPAGEHWFVQFNLPSSSTNGYISVGLNSQIDIGGSCEQIDEMGDYFCSGKIMDRVSNKIIGNGEIEFKRTAGQYSGVLKTNIEGNKIYNFKGFDNAIVGAQGFRRAYVNDVQELAGIDGTSSSGLMPANGIWAVIDELNGLPGRGISLDVQDGLAVIQIYNYLENGASTFHMGSELYRGRGTSIAINRYQNGIYFGGPPQEAQFLESAGFARIAIQNSDSAQYNIDYGFIEFPKESGKLIKRINLNPDSNTLNGLRGYWYFSSVQKVYKLENISNNRISDSKGEIFCEFSDVLNKKIRCTTSAAEEINFTSNINGASRNARRLTDSLGNVLGI
ncbi:hypothetical protein [Comamonas odontotermitis]|uniref:hypothetical protein n=1 Tax=Comamonas odontotermitis TaxID=379895 RepID=UPI001CC4058A|nr:hypothetical protein [Comamonas odontotermitis]UBB15269.1 hypothetical protein LAD35_10250 [Comamonas odontotermitis]